MNDLEFAGAVEALLRRAGPVITWDELAAAARVKMRLDQMTAPPPADEPEEKPGEPKFA
ncbi:hypothetical protein [Hansschlegelia beijingensis]|uniref:Uncharacterized protein n=1 Tax=Hansschlegelia beijingensis TaxID=1133344 RepID=A0A7W6D416_9HYPH|nr:hypothetical protein [Hansschlegelia beijingensis]MBB3972793.1 hypothetical protein [Hansschlegelia beijingensis]